MHVIFMCPHFPASQRRFVRGLKNVGARVTGIGDSPAEMFDDGLKRLLDGYEHVPHIGDEDAVFAAVRRIQARGPWVHRFEATIESHMGVVARVRERTSIPGLSWQTVERCRDKLVMKDFLRAHGVPCARAAAVATGDDLRSFVEAVGWPVILKPRDGAGAHATYKLSGPDDLARAVAETGIDHRPAFFIAEEFVTGHEGFFDTITAGGKVLFEGISHYYPNVLEALRDRSASPMILATNRMESEGYAALRQFGRQVISALDIDDSATHMEWFYGPKGLSFAEIGARPPGVDYFEVHSAANEVDLFTTWARAVCWGAVDDRPTHRYAAGLLNLRPDRDGVVAGVVGADEVQRRYGEHITAAKLPSPGERTQSIEAGYLANGWIRARHEDYDALREILEDIGRTLRIVARPA